MTARNSTRAYGRVARFFHWTVAALILAAIGLGLYANSLPRETPDQVQAVFAAFSLHKTVGIAALILLAPRILWALTQIKPRPLDPGGPAAFLADMVHRALWIGMIAMPLSGWLLHAAAPGGFSRILWPFGQRLPLVPEDAALAERLGQFHAAGWWLLAGLIALHVAGALKHALIDRDGVMNRMAGNPDRAPEPPVTAPATLSHLLASVVALLIWVAVAVPALQGGAETGALPQTAPPSGWAVEQGTLAIEVTQSGHAVTGSFGQWQAQISYDPASRAGHVTVEIDITSLVLGAVGDAAKGPEFLNAAAHPTATFAAEILPPTPAEPQLARGQLTIAGRSIEAALPFELSIDGNLATAQGRMVVDRRDFGIGAGYSDESTVGFDVTISFALTARQQ